MAEKAVFKLILVTIIVIGFGNEGGKARAQDLAGVMQLFPLQKAIRSGFAKSRFTSTWLGVTALANNLYFNDK